MEHLVELVGFDVHRTMRTDISEHDLANFLILKIFFSLFLSHSIDMCLCDVISLPSFSNNSISRSQPTPLIDYDSDYIILPSYSESEPFLFHIE